MDSLVSSPPSFNRLPPDGHEFPPNYLEEQIMPSKTDYYHDLKNSPPPLPPSGPPPLKKLSSRYDKELNKPTANRISWRKDEKSEKSVKDKIAMFSNSTDSPTGKLSKYKSSEDVFYDEEAPPPTLQNTKLFSRSVVSVDRVGYCRQQSDVLPVPNGRLHYTNGANSSIDLSSSSSAYSSSCSPDSSLSSTTSSYLGYSSTLPKKKQEVPTKTIGLTRTTSFTNGSLHGRSQSMIDVNTDHRNSSLNFLIEQRKKNFTKLRGLVIPEKVTENNNVPSQTIFDLPEIKSRDTMLAKTKYQNKNTVNPWEKTKSLLNSTNSLSNPIISLPNTNVSLPNSNISLSSTTSSLLSSPWKSPLPNIPKYSPAFKRKSISVYGTTPKKESPPSKPPRSFAGADSTTTISAKTEECFELRNGKKDKSYDDSDNDSAVSSSRSSISHGYSPPSSPSLNDRSSDDGGKRPLSRTHSSETTASSTSTLTQASSSSSGDGNKRILKPQSVEAINRKNVLTSAKYSRGFDVKNGSPLIQRKVIEGSNEEEDKESVLSFESSHTVEANEECLDVVNYKLTDNYNCDNNVKIAFLNVDDVDSGIDMKKKVEKTESTPCNGSMPQAAPRRTSVPLLGKEPKWDYKPEGMFNTSTDSLRSRTSSIDTVIEHGNYRTSRIDSIDRRNDFDDKREYRLRRSIDMDSDILPSRLTASEVKKNSISVKDIRTAFEKAELALANTRKQNGGNHVRMSSLDSTTSEESYPLMSGTYESGSNLHREQFGSITSLASSTSLISPQELQLLIEDANQTLEESGTIGGPSDHDVVVVILHRDTAGGSVGITLAGGADYEAKEITVHKVLAGSPADRDGRIQKGDRILSINGKSMKGITHRESLAILKSPRPEVVLVVSRLKADNQETVSSEDNLLTTIRSSLNGGTTRPPRILEGTTLSLQNDINTEDIARGPPVVVTLLKDGAGLGFSLEGGKDSPFGDKPLVIKKIFTGGAAEKSGFLEVNDELLNVNGMDVIPMSRIEAWKLMKRLPDGKVTITVRRRVIN